MSEIFSRLQEQILKANWIDLQFHLHKGNVFIVPQEVDIALVGEAIVTDQESVIRAWLQSGHLVKVTDKNLYKKETIIRMLIVQPFVLIQEFNQD
jgi:hypothetical protein